jgi:murein L,D-transpeptidase YafK
MSRPRAFALRASIAGAAVVAVAIACGTAAQAGRYGDRPLPRSARIDRIVVYKGEHRLEAWSGEALLKSYRIAIGVGGEGPKVYEGDARTPEGTYRIDSRHRSRQFHRFLHVSYPNREDRRRHREARARGEVPDGAGIGGAIGIHGEGDTPLVGMLGIDWTAGCIAVTDEEAEELYRAVVDEAVILIHP